MASEGPGNWWQKTPQGLKGRNKTPAHFNPKSRPFRAEKILFANIDLGLRALRFTPGCHITGFQPGNVQTPEFGETPNRATGTLAPLLRRLTPGPRVPMQVPFAGRSNPISERLQVLSSDSPPTEQAVSQQVAIAHCAGMTAAEVA